MAGDFLTRASASVHISHRFSEHFPEVAAINYYMPVWSTSMLNIANVEKVS
jgi:hypothetical protein